MSEDNELRDDLTEKDTLHWSYRGFENLPDELEHATHLTDLYMKHNQIKTIPKWIGKLVNLSILQLHSNNIEQVPEEIGLLRNLHRLDLGCNKLTTIPSTIKDLKNLCDLNLENNKLTSLPNEIGSLAALYCLILNHNELTTLPYTLGCCTSLQELHAECNNLVSIPNSLTFLPNLSAIRLESNKLLYFPAIPFINNPYIGCINNRTFNYISHDLYLNIMSLMHYDNKYRNGFTCGDVEHDNYCYNYLPNAMVEITFRGKKKVLILPETLQTVSQYTNKYGLVPSLREMLLRKIYEDTPSTNKSIFYYKLNDNYLPQQIKELFIKGPTAQCRTCKQYIFTECIIWITPQLLNCSICIESDILTMVYFCSKRCVHLYTDHEGEDIHVQKLSSLTIDWTKVK